MLSSIIDHYKDVIFNITLFFENTRKEDSVKAVPFFVNAKNLNSDCDFMYDGRKMTADGIMPHYCAFPEHVSMYLKFGAKPFTCKGCENYKPTN